MLGTIHGAHYVLMMATHFVCFESVCSILKNIYRCQIVGAVGQIRLVNNKSRTWSILQLVCLINSSET